MWDVFILADFQIMAAITGFSTEQYANEAAEIMIKELSKDIDNIEPLFRYISMEIK